MTATEELATDLTLSEDEFAYLVGIRDHDPRPYLREKAAAFIKIAGGATAGSVALRGLLKPRKPDTIYDWLRRFKSDRKFHPRPATRAGIIPPERLRRNRRDHSPGS